MKWWNKAGLLGCLIAKGDEEKMTPWGFGKTTWGQPKVGLTSEAYTSKLKSVSHFFGADVLAPNVSPTFSSLYGSHQLRGEDEMVEVGRETKLGNSI